MSPARPELAAIPAERPSRRELPIGAILIDTGRLRAPDAEKVLRLQRTEGLRFGDAAIKLGLVTEADVQHALSLQFEYPYLTREAASISPEVFIAHDPFSPQAEGFRALRTQLMLRWFGVGPERRAMAVLSPGRREGRTYVAANLAVALSQLGERTLLIDADLRNPRQHTLFDIPNRGGLSTLLSGRGDETLVQRLASLPNLAILPAGATPPNPQELLGKPVLQEILLGLEARFDVVLLDSPAAAESADAQTIAFRAKGSLLVARRGVTRIRESQTLVEQLAGVNASVVGTVLNDF